MLGHDRGQFKIHDQMTQESDPKAVSWVTVGKGKDDACEITQAVFLWELMDK